MQELDLFDWTDTEEGLPEDHTEIIFDVYGYKSFAGFMDSDAKFHAYGSGGVFSKAAVSGWTPVQIRRKKDES